MQRVVRSSLVGLLTLAGLTACGDKVTVTNPPTPVPGTVVHSVTVSPASATIGVGGTGITLAASVDADAGVTVRTVTWTSSDATVATVSSAGQVVGVKSGVVTIVAAATADPTVKGASVVTVQASAPASISIAGATQTVCAVPGPNIVPPCSTVNANLANFGTAAGSTGQLDVTLNVDDPNHTLKTLVGTLKCGNETMTQTQTLSGAPPADAAENAAPVALSFVTTQLTSANVPILHNNPACTLSATGTTASGTTVASNTATLVLNNADGVLTSVTFAGGATANDQFSLPWKSGAPTVTAIPVLYNVRTIATVAITLCRQLNCGPGAANVPTQTVTTATNNAYTATWSTATSGAAPRVGQQTIVGGPDPLLANATLAALPGVRVVDTNGNDVPLIDLNSPLGANPAAFRLDDQSPAAPTTFQIPVRQGNWINGTYAFTGTGGAMGSATGKYVSGGDGGAAVAGVFPAGEGVSFGAVAGNGYVGSNTTFPPTGLTTFQVWYAPAASFTPLANTTAPGTAIGANCVTTGLTQVPATGDIGIPSSSTNTAYSVRIFEFDRLNNVRCTDLGLAATPTQFGVDRVAPTAVFVEPAADPTSAGANQLVSCASAGVASPCPGIAVPNFRVALSDDASGFNATPMTTKLTRLAINPVAPPYGGVAGTGVAATPNDANGFGCPVGWSTGNGDCETESTGFVIPADGQHNAPPAGGPITSSGTDGYYTITWFALDLARNASATLTRTVLVDRQAPVMGGIAVPATIVGGASASFATSATDNLDLTTTDYTLSYPITPSGSLVPLNIRANGPTIGTAFDNVLTTNSSFSLNVPFFIRNIATTTAANAPQDNGVPPNQIAVRAYDAGGNVSNPGISAINAANVPQTTPQSPNVHTNFAALQANGATFLTFQVSNTATSVSNCQASGCAGGAAAANATTVNLTATATGTEQAGPPTFQFLNPFTQVQFYYFDNTTGEWTLAGTTTAPTVTDNALATIRTFTWTLAGFDPPARLGPAAAGALNLFVVAVGVNAAGDALGSAVNGAISLTNP